MAQPPPKLEIVQDRIRIGGGLTVSVNRSWRVAAVAGQRPVAAFKGTAPVLLQGDAPVFMAAVGEHDAFWLGFEVEGDAVYAVVITIDGSNPWTHTPGTALQRAPANFLLLPDQPWFDCVEEPDGQLRQLLRPAGEEGSCRIALAIYAEPPDAVERQESPSGPQPLYAGKDTAGEAHRWPARALLAEDLPLWTALEILMVSPPRYEQQSGVPLPREFFDLPQEPPPPPHNPFA